MLSGPASCQDLTAVRRRHGGRERGGRGGLAVPILSPTFIPQPPPPTQLSRAALFRDSKHFDFSVWARLALFVWSLSVRSRLHGQFP